MQFRPASSRVAPFVTMVAIASIAFPICAASASAQNPITRVSVDSAGVQEDSDSGALSGAAISEDGRFVAFESFATNLVANDQNGVADIFVHDRIFGVTVRVSVDSAGAEADGYSASPALSKDGRFVAFESLATNLVASDTNGAFDVFVHDRDPDTNGLFDEGNGVTVRVSVRTTGTQGNFDSFTPAISGDGNMVAFASSATNLVTGDKNGVSDVFLHDRAAGTTRRISAIGGSLDANGPSYTPSLSSDGRLVAFTSFASVLVPGGDLNGFADILLYDDVTGGITRMSVDTAGGESNDDSNQPCISGDGSVVAFTSSADDLDSGDLNFSRDVFVHEVATGITQRVSLDSAGIEGNGDSSGPSLSFDGRFVAFQGAADNWVANDLNFATDVFLRDRSAGTLECMTVNCVTALADGFGSNLPALSADAQLVVFASSATNLVVDDTDGTSDIFLRDRSISPPLASWNNYGAGYPGKLGFPTLTVNASPVFGTTITIDASNSVGSSTIGLLFVGLNSASIPTNVGGTILVDWNLILPVAIDPVSFTIDATVPAEISLCDAHAFMQMIQFDPGAAFGFAFSPGLDLAPGL